MGVFGCIIAATSDACSTRVPPLVPPASIMRRYPVISRADELIPPVGPIVSADSYGSRTRLRFSSSW